jgi:hypothetical protein
MRRLIVRNSKTKRSADFIALPEKLDGLHGPSQACRSSLS